MAYSPPIVSPAPERCPTIPHQTTKQTTKKIKRIRIPIEPEPVNLNDLQATNPKTVLPSNQRPRQIIIPPPHWLRKGAVLPSQSLSPHLKGQPATGTSEIGASVSISMSSFKPIFAFFLFHLFFFSLPFLSFLISPSPDGLADRVTCGLALTLRAQKY